MFYYYGAKRRLARHYPPPQHDLIVEPFAGAAGYSMFWLPQRPTARAILVEKDERVAEVWRRLLGMSPEEIHAYPLPLAGEATSDRLIMLAAASNAVGVCTHMKVSPRMRIEVERMLRSAASLRRACGERVEVRLGDYTTAPDVEATWFVDPPYSPQPRDAKTARPGGMGYAPGCSSDGIDYAVLGEWCRARRGQVIVCEADGAAWLPFQRLRSGANTLGRRTVEVVWTNQATA